MEKWTICINQDGFIYYEFGKKRGRLRSETGLITIKVSEGELSDGVVTIYMTK